MEGVIGVSNTLLALLLTWAVPDTPGRRPVEWLVLGAAAAVGVAVWSRGVSWVVLLVPSLILMLMYPPVLNALRVVGLR